MSQRKPDAIERFDWQQMQTYWREHAALRGMVDYGLDPDALNNVCYAGAPLWWNRYHARIQESVFEDLMRRLPIARNHPLALDVGCGGGRWTRRLLARGYRVTGIDLQASLIARNRPRYPEATFHTCSLQAFNTDERFEVISSVTVIQHIPFAEQEMAVAQIAKLLRPGGYAIVLENVRDQSHLVFARTVDGWTDLFARHRLVLRRVRRYDYSPVSACLRKIVRVIPTQGASTAPARDGDGTGAPRSPWLALWPRANTPGWSLAVALARGMDIAIEPLLARPQLPVPSAHLGLLFERAAAS
jgi:SAM-dependent methyltransferase